MQVPINTNGRLGKVTLSLVADDDMSNFARKIIEQCDFRADMGAPIGLHNKESYGTQLLIAIMDQVYLVDDLAHCLARLPPATSLIKSPPICSPARSVMWLRNRKCPPLFALSPRTCRENKIRS